MKTFALLLMFFTFGAQADYCMEGVYYHQDFDLSANRPEGFSADEAIHGHISIPLDQGHTVELCRDRQDESVLKIAIKLKHVYRYFRMDTIKMRSVSELEEVLERKSDLVGDGYFEADSSRRNDYRGVRASQAKSKEYVFTGESRGNCSEVSAKRTAAEKACNKCFLAGYSSCDVMSVVHRGRPVLGNFYGNCKGNAVVHGSNEYSENRGLTSCHSIDQIGERSESVRNVQRDQESRR